MLFSSSLTDLAILEEFLNFKNIPDTGIIVRIGIELLQMINWKQCSVFLMCVIFFLFKFYNLDVMHPEGEVMLVASSGWKPGMLDNILQCTGRSPTSEIGPKCHLS